jgi:hypothetical protein
MRTLLAFVFMLMLTASSAWATVIPANLDPNDFCGLTSSSSIQHFQHQCPHGIDSVCHCAENGCDDGNFSSDCGCWMKPVQTAARLSGERFLQIQPAALFANVFPPTRVCQRLDFSSQPERIVSRSDAPNPPPPRH